jgi:hypothetical protein
MSRRVRVLSMAIGGMAIGFTVLGPMAVLARASDQKLAWSAPGTSTGAVPPEYALAQFAAPHEVVVCATNAVQVIVDQGLSATSQQVTLPLAGGGCMILDAVFIWVKNPTAASATGSFQDLGLVPSGGPDEAKKASP